MNARRPHGFTLIEIILTLVLIGGMIAILTPFYSAGIYSTHEPVDRLQDDVALNRVLENMIADFQDNFYDNNSTMLQQFSTKLDGAANATGYGDYTVVSKVLDKYPTSSNPDQDLANLANIVDDNSRLVVTIANADGERLTYWFMRQNRGSSSP